MTNNDNKYEVNKKFTCESLNAFFQIRLAQDYMCRKDDCAVKEGHPNDEN